MKSSPLKMGSGFLNLKDDRTIIEKNDATVNTGELDLVEN